MWSYPTVKYVQIQDSRLALLQYLLIASIVFYVGFYELFAQGGWLQFSPVEGVVRFSLQHPTVHNCDPTRADCHNAFEPLSRLPYCEQHYNTNSNTSTSSDGISREKDLADDYGNEAFPIAINHRQLASGVYYKGQVYPCEIYESINAQIISEKSLTIITRASTIEQEFVCAVSNSDTCARTYNNTGQEFKFYTAQSESFTVLVDHAATSSKICQQPRSFFSLKRDYACSSEASAYHGRLHSRNSDLCQLESRRENAFQSYHGNQTTETAPCYINPNRTQQNQDFFSLDVLLKASGIELDDCNPHAASSNKNFSGCQTYRDTGATLLLSIFWSDFQFLHGCVAPYYYYAPQLVARAGYKQYLPFYDQPYRQHRTLLNAHGIRVAVLLSGEFSQFNFLQFVMTLTTALGFLAVATTVVDSLMLYILPEKRRYQEAKYERDAQEFDNAANQMVRTIDNAANQVVRSTVSGLTDLLTPQNAFTDQNIHSIATNHVIQFTLDEEGANRRQPTTLESSSDGI